MIIDPQRNGVYIWTDSNVTSIKGDNIPDICKEIYSRVVQPRKHSVTGEILYDQIYELYIDIGGVGVMYKDILTDMGLIIHDIRYRNVNIVLPVRCECESRYETNCYRSFDVKPIF